MPDIQEGGGLVQHQQFRLLAQGPGQQHPLALAVADAVKIPLGDILRPHAPERRAHHLVVMLCQSPEPPRVATS